MALPGLPALFAARVAVPWRWQLRDGDGLTRALAFGHFLDEQRYTVCLGNDLLEHGCWEGFPIGHAYNNLFHLGM